jgi:hypothetical protein
MVIPDQSFSIKDQGSRVDKIPDPDPHQRIQVILTQKADKKVPGCSSRIPEHGSGFFSISDPGVTKTGSCIRIRNTEFSLSIDRATVLFFIQCESKYRNRKLVSEYPVSPRIVPINTLNLNTNQNILHNWADSDCAHREEFDAYRLVVRKK